MKPLSAVVAAATLAAAMHAPVALAEESGYSSVNDHPSAGAMAFDLLAVRPLGLASLVIGSTLFVLQLPFDIAVEDGVRAPFEALVAKPARFTFARPLGSNE